MCKILNKDEDVSVRSLPNFWTRVHRISQQALKGFSSLRGKPCNIFLSLQQNEEALYSVARNACVVYTTVHRGSNGIDHRDKFSTKDLIRNTGKNMPEEIHNGSQHFFSVSVGRHTGHRSARQRRSVARWSIWDSSILNSMSHSL